jgi:acetyl esterase/lipase
VKVKPRACSLTDFPVSVITCPGIKVLQADERKRSVTVIPGVEYARKSGIPLHVTILTPRLAEGEKTVFPLVLFVQGSAWFKQDLNQQVAQLANFAGRGFVIAITEYRPSTVDPFPAQIQDARTAARFMLQHAPEYNADPEKFVLWGDSSGGHTVTMMAVTEGNARFSDEDGVPLPIKGVVDFYGPTNLGTMNDEPSTQDHDAPDSPEGSVLGGVRVCEHPDLVGEASPLTYITSSSHLPPFLIMHGDKDRLVPYGQSVLLYRKLGECNQPVEMYRIAGADHSGNAFWTADEPLRITEAFLRACL